MTKGGNRLMSNSTDRHYNNHKHGDINSDHYRADLSWVGCQSENIAYKARILIVHLFRFIPIQTSLPDSSYSGSGGADPLAKRDLDVSVSIGDGSKAKQQGYLGISKEHYPKGVTCYKWTGGKCVHKVTTMKTTTMITPSTTVSSIHV